MVPPNTNRGPTVAAQTIWLGGRRPATSSCRDEVAAALFALAVRDGRSVFTVREVYTQMVAGGTGYAESTVFKTMQRMKEAPKRPPTVQLERAEGEGFRIVE